MAVATVVAVIVAPEVAKEPRDILFPDDTPAMYWVSVAAGTVWATRLRAQEHTLSDALLESVHQSMNCLFSESL
jgi:hypothetical protein